LTPQAYLERETWAGADKIYHGTIPDNVRTQLVHELDLIKTLGYAPYFLTVYDIVNYARSKDILCQGRGSAANSAVCYVLGITAIDPVQSDLLFERFISTERNEPPDIDVDFEHERREEVIQYVYGKYTREHAGIAATVISYRGKSAIRDVGKAMGLSLDRVGALAKGLWGWRGAEGDIEQLYELGLDPREPRLAKAIDLAAELEGFPRHLSQHVGGFVITKSPLHEMVPIENAAMKDRTFVAWDKDDLDALGILKIDVLALGMLTAIRKNLDLLRQHHGMDMQLVTVPTEDAATYDMLCEADSIGVFQVESRAQMSFLPRMKPRTLYDLVIEVAIVRPGPIQGGMIHPYLRRRNGEEDVDYPSSELEAVLGKTLGVPLFQEQAMKMAIVAGGFTPGEADRLRRAMATFRRTGTIHTFRIKMVEGMVSKGYKRDYAERCFKQIEGFGEYGFPESHAASFALLAYISAWLKCHYPAAFCCALLNSQPMGFYAPAQLVRDARNHGVEVRPVDINRSSWDCSLEPDGMGRMALRLGFRQVKGLSEADMVRLIECRNIGYAKPESLWRRAGLDAATLECLADADCFGSMGLDRRQALWQVRGLGEPPPPLFAAIEETITIEPDARLPSMATSEQVMADYRALRLSLKAHPVSFLRNELAARNIASAAQLADVPDGRTVTVAGLVLVRQRPGTGNAIFVTLEDETGIVNVIVWPTIFDQFRRTMLQSRLLVVRGKLQRQDIVVHIIAESMVDHSGLLASLTRPDAVTRAPREMVREQTVFPSRDFH
jgi:error-prone DNA polymerase